MTGVLGFAPGRMLGQATAPSSSEPQKNWKDRAEYDLFEAITKDTNPRTRLEKLQQWEKQYPQTDWAKERRTLFLTTYAAIPNAKEAVEAAKKILADDPKNFTASYYIMFFTQALGGLNPSPEVLDQGEKSSTAILANINTPPPNVTEEQWRTARTEVENLAHTTLGWVAMTRKNWALAEEEYLKSLKLNPNNGQVVYFLAGVLYSTKDPAKTPTALFYFARAASYDGPGALNPAGRQQVLDYVKRAYKGYHGSDEGFNDLLAQAKNSPTPTNLNIKSAVDIAKEKEAKEAEEAAKNPELTMWKNIKAQLTGPEGAGYFNSSMKDALLPTFKGKVVKLEPAVKPKTIVLALEDGVTGDATLKFEAALPGAVDPGTELSFEGVPESYTASPFMVHFNVEKDKLHGWTGKNVAPTPAHRAPVHKAAPKK